MFKKDFAQFACEGDTIACEVDGFECSARLARDLDSGPPDKMCDGFWPSLDPKDAGYIGPKSKATLARHMRRAQAVMDAWNSDHWHYFGVVVTVSSHGVELATASLWGIEGNYPFGRQARRNKYLRWTANELLPEALDAARATLGKLALEKHPAP